MEMITERRRLLGLQHQLNKRLTAAMPNTIERKLLIPKLNKKVIANYSSKLMKWFFYLDNTKEQEFSFFVGNWKYGAEPVSNNGSISISWNGDASNACIFAKENEKVLLLHSGNMGGKEVVNFFEKYEGEITNDIDGLDNQYAVVGRMDDIDIAEKVVRFFDFLTV